MYTNARSIVNKIQELKLYVEDANPDIIAITESWTHCNIPNSYLNLPNYYVAARHDRKDTLNGRGGGILIYVKNCLKSYETTDHCGFNQYASIEIILSKSNSLGLYVVYRSPNSTRNNNDQLIDVLRTVKNPAIVVGDFNYPLADWNTLQGCTDSQMLIDLVLDQFWTQSVTFPTHKSGNVLDLVFAETGIVNGVHDDGQLGSSDHSVLMIETNQLFSVNSGRNARLNYGKADFDKLRKLFKECDWRQVLDSDDVNVCWTRFKDVYDTVVGQCVPFYYVKRRKNPPWMSRDLLKLVKQKRKLWKKCKNDPCAQNLNEFKSLSSSLKKKIRKAKLNFEKMVAKNSKQNPKAFYAYIGGKRLNRTGVGPLQDVQGNIVTDDKAQAQMLNDYYASVFELEQLPPPVLPPIDGPVMQKLVIYECTVREEIKKLKRYSSPGPDGIANVVLLEACDELARPLTKLFRMSLQQSVVPDDWRIANVTPVYKAGNKKDVSNYRPISLTSTVSKVLESIIRAAVVAHLLSNSLIRSSQHGFMAKKSCLSNLLHCMEEITKILDDGDAADVLYLDFAKAFDKVPHQRLICKMKSLNIDGEVIAWIQAWLSGRKQRVVLNGHQSDLIPVPCGVPQGSVFGPTGFVIFIDDIDLCIEALLALLLKFADDTKVIKRIRCNSDNHDLQLIVSNLHAWAERWQMYFNVNKCKVVHLGRNNPRFKYFMAGVEIKAVDSERDLGMILDHTGKPSLQCAKAAQKGNQVLGQLLRSFQCRDKEVLTQLYKVFVRPHLEYAIQAWSPYTVKDIEVLEKVQKRMVRQITSLRGTYEEKLAKIGLTTLQERRIRGDCIETFKMLKGFTRVNHEIWFSIMSRAEGAQTRLSSDPLVLNSQLARLDLRKNFYSVRVPQIWNSLPLSVRQSTSVNQFKNAYDNHKSQI